MKIIFNKTILCVMFFMTILSQNCSLKSEPEINVKDQKMIYDSIHYKGKRFNVNLYTTLEFNRKSIKRNEYNDFFIVIKKDTFPLVPEINSFKIKDKDGDNLLSVKFLSYINFKSNTFDNDSLTRIISNSSKIINSKGETIINPDSNNINSLITLPMRKKSNILIE